MRVRRQAVGWVLLVLVLVLAGALPARADGHRHVRGEAGPVVVAPRSTEDDGLRVESTTTYTLDPAVPVVRVRYQATITHERPSRSTYGYTEYSYFPEFGMLVLGEATNLVAATPEGAPLPARIEDTEVGGLRWAVVELNPALLYKQSRTVVVTYDLPRSAPRAEGFTRINEAFATFTAFAEGDGGLTTIEVVLPDAADVELIGGDLKRQDRDGQQVYRADAIADPDEFYVDVVARHDDALVRRTVEMGDHDVEVLAWPDDVEWADFVAGLVGDGLPELNDLIGIEWPAEGDIEVAETVAPYLYGYSGWYLPGSSLIEVGDDLDAAIIMHELAHVWFNHHLFRDRWVNEALADAFSIRVLSDLGHEVPVPEPVDPAGPGAGPLNAWSDPGMLDVDTVAAEAYGYNASWSAMQRIIEEIGWEAIGAVVQAAADHAYPYGAATDSSVQTRANDWRTLLDLLQEVGGSTTAEGVFRQLVVTSEQMPELDDRAAARTEYAALVEGADGWAPPAELRRLMGLWRFDEARELMAQVAEVSAAQTELLEVLDRLGVAVPPEVRVGYESAEDVDALLESTETALASALAVDAAAVDVGGGPLGAAGRLVGDPDAALAEAYDMLADAEWARAAERATRAEQLAAAAPAAGLAAAVALAAVVAGWFAAWSRRQALITTLGRARRSARRTAT